MDMVVIKRYFDTLVQYSKEMGKEKRLQKGPLFFTIRF